MNHVAIDLGSRESQVCVRQADGTIVFERKHPTRSLSELMRAWPPSRVIRETSGEAFRVADAARAAGHEVRVVPSTLAKQLGVGERKIKTDARDARKLSEVSCRIDLPSVHIPSETARTLRSLIRSRELRLEARTKAVNHVRGWVRTPLWKLRSGATVSLPQRVRAHATAMNQVIPDHIERVLLVITRFPHAHQVQSYVGLTPGESSSSQRECRLSITKAGPASVRRTLIQAAWSAFLSRPNDPMVRWAAQIAERRGRAIAIVALARKLAGIMYALWRDDTTYQASKAAVPSTSEVPPT